MHGQPVLSDEALGSAMEARALRMLRRGITAARDLGGSASFASLRLRDRIERGEVPGPRLVCAGQPLTVPGGHCHQWGGAVSGAEEARAAIERQVARGADCIKAIRGASSPASSSRLIGPRSSTSVVGPRRRPQRHRSFLVVVRRRLSSVVVACRLPRVLVLVRVVVGRSQLR